jgi:hypothetical protein
MLVRARRTAQNASDVFLPGNGENCGLSVKFLLGKMASSILCSDASKVKKEIFVVGGTFFLFFHFLLVVVGIVFCFACFFFFLILEPKS